MPPAPAASYHSVVTIVGDLDRARRLIFAADEEAAKDLLCLSGSRSKRPTGTI